MSYEIGLQRLFEIKRLVADDCILTEEGVFAPGELPDDYDGSFEGTLQVVFATVHADISGRIRYTTYNPPELKNKDRNTGMPLKMYLGGAPFVAREGTVQPEIWLEWISNFDLPEQMQSIAGMSWNALIEQADEDTWRL